MDAENIPPQSKCYLDLRIINLRHVLICLGKLAI